MANAEFGKYFWLKKKNNSRHHKNTFIFAIFKMKHFISKMKTENIYFIWIKSECIYIYI